MKNVITEEQAKGPDDETRRQMRQLAAVAREAQIRRKRDERFPILPAGTRVKSEATVFRGITLSVVSDDGPASDGERSVRVMSIRDGVFKQRRRVLEPMPG